MPSSVSKPYVADKSFYCQEISSNLEMAPPAPKIMVKIWLDINKSYLQQQEESFAGLENSMTSACLPFDFSIFWWNILVPIPKISCSFEGIKVMNIWLSLHLGPYCSLSNKLLSTYPQ